MHYQLVTVLLLSNHQFLVAIIPGAPVSAFPSQEWWSCDSPSPELELDRRGQAWLAAVQGLVPAGWQKATFNNIHTLQLCDETLPVYTVSCLLVIRQKNTLCVVFLVAKSDPWILCLWLWLGSFIFMRICQMLISLFKWIYSCFSIIYPRDVVIACFLVCQATKKWIPQEASLKILESKSLLQSAPEKSNIKMR